jgi:hypothetical protein
MRWVRGVLLAVPAAAAMSYLWAGGQEKPPTYAAVKAIFAAHCFTCHAGETPAAGLDLSKPEGIRRAMKPGDAYASALVRRLKGEGGLPHMPMGFAPLSTEKIRTVEDWIRSGASFAVSQVTHWAYVAPVRPPIPETQQKGWIRNPIDAFVLARLEKEGMSPTAEASREALARRLYLDLIGLPPSPEEIDEFLGDTSADAYERLVDKLLASPHYGERQARPWLDLARYADTEGYESDVTRMAYQWRDWVIAAFNSNMPYDRFTIEQIAGDLLPEPTIDQLVATGFHRNTMFNREGGVDPAEAHFNVILDRANTTATVWLGSTLACARCHNHKFDPFTQKDYYRLAAYFANTVAEPRGDANLGAEKWHEPEITIPSPEVTAKIEALEKEIARLSVDVGPEEEYQAWLARASAPVAWTVPRGTSAFSDGGTLLSVGGDGAILATGENPANAVYTLRFEAANATAMRIEVLPHGSFKLFGPGRASSGNFILSAVEVLADGKRASLKDIGASFVQNGYDLRRMLTGDTSSGWAVYGRIGQPSELIVSLAAAVSGQIEMRLMFASKEWPQHTFGHFRISHTGSETPLNQLIPADVKRAIASGGDARAFYVSTAPSLESTRAALRTRSAELEAARAKIPRAMVLKEKPGGGIPKMHVRRRGEFLSLEEEVDAGVPDSLPDGGDALPQNRYGLALWLVDKSNPLTARVEVNRVWEQYFGRGLVSTPDDFGTQGAAPTHPELLDWLAVEFMQSGWDLKLLNKTIVMSAAYRQLSVADAARRAKDPENELISRGPRFRMEAEMIRDSALAASGLLDRRIGGPSVMPYQPDGVWDSPFSGERWQPSAGGDAFRRGLYTFIKRTAPYPNFMSFDATSRENCTATRIRTNTPLQALTLLNDLGMLEAAKGLAKRMLSVDGDARKRIEFGFRCCTSRTPATEETSRLGQLLDSLTSKYRSLGEESKKLADTPEGAAWVMVANTLLNLDETITKG